MVSNYHSRIQSYFCRINKSKSVFPKANPLFQYEWNQQLKQEQVMVQAMSAAAEAPIPHQTRSELRTSGRFLHAGNYM